MGSVSRIAPHIRTHPGKMQAIELLADGARLSMTWEEIANTCGVHRDTLYEWRQDPAFSEAVATVTRENLKEIIPGTFKTLIDVLKDKGADYKERMKAGELLLKAGGELIDRVDATHRTDARGILDALDRELEAIKSEAAPAKENA